MLGQVSIEASNSPPPLAVDAVYVLSVRSFQDRVAHVRRELTARGIDFEFIFDFDPEHLEPTHHSCFGGFELKLPHKSLVLKHMHAWHLACERQQRRILVFEDDIILRRRFLPLLRNALDAADALPSGWLVFLGGADTKVPDSFFLEPGPLIPMPIATADGYVTDLAACRRRLAWCSENKITLPADTLIRQIDAKTGVRHYWLTEAAVEQGSVTGRFASTLDAHRMKHSLLANAARYRWVRFHRRMLRAWWVRLTRGRRKRQITCG